MENLERIKLNNVYFSIKDLEVIRGISFSVSQGEVLIIVGRSGSGKSTLLKLCGGLYSPNRGEVYIDGVNINNISNKKKQKMMSKIGFITHTGGLMANLNVFENIALPLKYHNNFNESDLREIIMDKLNHFGVYKIRDKHPDSLSPGHKKIICFIRETITKNSILILDDPLNYVDNNTSLLFMDSISESIKEGCTVIISTHDPEISNIPSKMAVVDEGMLVAHDETNYIIKAEDKSIKPIMLDIGLYQGIIDDIMIFLEDEIL